MATITLYKKSKRQPCYRLSYRDPETGKWRQKYLHTTRDQAEEIRKKVEAEFVWLQANPHLRTVISSLSLEEVISSFVKSKNHEVSPSTVQRYKYGLEYVTKTLGGDYPITSVTQNDVDRIIAFTQDEGLSASSTNTVLRHLRVLLNWAYDRQVIGKVPKIKQIKTQQKEIHWLTKKEVGSILEHAPEIIGDLVRLYIITGARRNELLYSTWRDINLKRKRIRLREVKSKKQEYLFLNDQAVQILTKYKENTPRPFTLSQDQLRHRYEKVCEVAKVDSTIHDLRRTCGARLIEKGSDIFRVSRFLRHSSVKVTQEHYVDLLPDDYSHLADIIEV